ncbi:MAG TPA: outer membrane beta-barrel protein [Syntrophales bacterium]|nr:outer membrane beta-barrel protein [Syntrophales bacterium]
MKTQIKIGLPVLLLTVFVATGAVYAQPYYPPVSPLYFGIFGGYVAPQNMNWSSQTSGASTDLSLDSSGLVGLKLGYILPQARAVAFEFEWNYMFQQNMPAQNAGAFTESGNVALNNFLVNLILRYPEGRFHPYVGGGIGGSSVNIQNTEIRTSTGAVVNVANETSTAFAWQVLAGVNFELAPNLSADLGYRYFGTNPSYTAINTTYRAQAVTLGINFHF